VMIGPELIRLRPASSAAAARPLKVLSANVWAQNPTPDEAIKAILAQDADLIALQEIDGSVGASASGLAARYPFVSPCAQRGVRIFSKTAILASGCPQMGTAVGVLDAVWVRVATAQGPAILLTTHFTRPYPPGLQAVDRTLLQTLVAELPPGPLIVTGDFNTTPWSYAMRTQDRLLKPLQRRSIAFPSWPARWTLVRRSWSLPLLPIDHIYTGADWPSAELRRIRVPSSDHFGFVAQIYHC